MKRKKIIPILSIVFTVLSFVFFNFALLDIIYILTLEKGFASVLIGFYFALVCFVLLVLVFAFAVAGGVLSVINMKKYGKKPLYFAALTVSSVLTAISSIPILLALVFSIIG